MRFRAVLALLLTGFSASAGHLVAVRAVAGAEATVVQLDSDAPPSFTTLKLSSPPRIVVDLADTSAPGVAAQQDVEDAVVRRIAVAEAGARTTRVVIELATEAEFDVRASESRVEVRIPRAVAVALVDAPAPSDEKEQAETGPQPPVAAGSEPKRAGDDESAAQSAAGSQAKSPPEIAERAALPTVALVGAPAPGGATSGGPGRGRELVPPSAEQLHREAEHVHRGAEQVHKGGEQGHRGAGEVHINGIGFRPLSGGEVIVRSDRPVEYEVSSGENAVLIHLRSARIPLQNNRRPLDTRFFEGAIQRVVPLQVPGGTDIRIELRQRAEVHLEQSGPLLTVSFTPRS